MSAEVEVPERVEEFVPPRGIHRQLSYLLTGPSSFQCFIPQDFRIFGQCRSMLRASPVEPSYL